LPPGQLASTVDTAVRTLVEQADLLTMSARDVLTRVRPVAPAMPGPALATAQLVGRCSSPCSPARNRCPAGCSPRTWTQFCAPGGAKFPCRLDHEVSDGVVGVSSACCVAKFMINTGKGLPVFATREPRPPRPVMI
jgi:hypothetical protein